jgi:hypothetical protein
MKCEHPPGKREHEDHERNVRARHSTADHRGGAQRRSEPTAAVAPSNAGLPFPIADLPQHPKIAAMKRPGRQNSRSGPNAMPSTGARDHSRLINLHSISAPYAEAPLAARIELEGALAKLVDSKSGKARPEKNTSRSGCPEQEVAIASPRRSESGDRRSRRRWSAARRETCLVDRARSSRPRRPSAASFAGGS